METVTDSKFFIKNILEEFLVVMDISDREAMLLTIRMNRAKGVHEASSMAKIAKKL